MIKSIGTTVYVVHRKYVDEKLRLKSLKKKINVKKISKSKSSR